MNDYNGAISRITLSLHNIPSNINEMNANQVNTMEKHEGRTSTMNAWFNGLK